MDSPRHNGFWEEILRRLTRLRPWTPPPNAAKLGVHQEILDGETSFAQQMVIRGAARESFAQVDSSHRIRAALLHRAEDRF